MMTISSRRTRWKKGDEGYEDDADYEDDEE